MNKTSKTSVPDKIDQKILNFVRISTAIIPCLDKKFQEKRLNHIKLPEDWNLPTIASIFKEGKNSLADNCTPVSLTSKICKLYENFSVFI